MRARLYRVALHYGGGLRLHTATSGLIDALDELVLELDDQGTVGIGAVRINIAYLNHLQPDDVIADVLAALGRRASGEAPSPAEPRLAPTRMLIDMAEFDLRGKREGRGVAALLAGGPDRAIACPTNQTLFWSDMETMLHQARAYVARGFTRLKLRIAVGTFEEDLARLAALRSGFGKRIELAVDANGRWTAEEAVARLHRLAAFDLAYVEQPILGPVEALGRLARVSAVPIMLDESLASPADVAELIAEEGRLWAHLKLVKLGGIRATSAAAKDLSRARVPFMVGQMNEGAIATAAAAHLAAAVDARFFELYGADGLVDDPASGVTYESGLVHVAAGPGLGIRFESSKAQLIAEF